VIRGLFHVGVDQHLAPLDVRELVAQDAETSARIVAAMHAEGWASEVALLSTCNRTELYVVTGETDGADLALGAWLRHVPGAPAPNSGYYRREHGLGAALHLLRVTSGLESAILGETEIQGQVRAAHERGQKTATVGPMLDRLFQTALRAGKRARHETGLSAGGVSHGSAAASVVRRIFDTLDDRGVLVVGAGQIAAQAARAVAEIGAGHLVIANRTAARAEALADDLLAATGRQAAVRGLDDLLATIGKAHVAILATGAAPLSVADIETAMKRRREPLLLIDLGVPRCVATAASAVRGVFLYDLEALEQLVAGALASRRESIPAVEALLREELDEFTTWLRGRGAMPALRSLHDWAESIRAAEMRWLPADAPPETREAVERLTRRLVQRLLGRATARVVKGTSSENSDLPTAEDLKSLFGLEEGESR